MNPFSKLFRHRPRKGQQHFGKVVLGALGVVYGDIGTSPLYAFKECFNGPHAVAVTPENILGVLSLIFWSIVLVVIVKYLMTVMRADNHGEGGIVALMALLMQKAAPGQRAISSSKVVLLGLFGAALLYGDGIITPAISVLSAVEGLEVATPFFHPYIVPITLVILISLFLVQRHGTARMGSIFGPATLLWFISIAAIAIPWIKLQPKVLLAILPIYAFEFMVHEGKHAFLVLSAVVLCITGAEALYADMGHFGRRPIRVAWYMTVFPALVLNYFGQGALLLQSGADAAVNPFYGLVPKQLLYPMVGLATVATVIASQALISGAFSLTHQAMQLGFLPRVSVVHTSEHAEGQIYVPRINLLMMIGCLALVLVFRQSSNLAAAYGIAVTGTMAITTILFFAVACQIWHWPLAVAGLVASVFLSIDLAFFVANTAKFFSGGWVPVLIAAAIFIVMTTWQRGRTALGQAMISRSMPLSDFMAQVELDKPHRVKGTAIFMTPTLDVAPGVLLHHYRHNQVLHEKIVILTILTKKIPYVPFDEHGRRTDLGNGFSRIVAKYGFMEQPNVLTILSCGQTDCARENVSFYLGRESFITTGMSGMAMWRKRLFAFMARNAQSASVFFRVPANQVIELGSQIEL